MALITVGDVDTFAFGNETSDADRTAEINQLIPQAEALFYSLLKVDTLESQVAKDEIARFKSNSIWFKNFPITKINSIGGEAYEGEDFTDYIVTKNKVDFHCPDFLSKIRSNRVQVNYDYGYTAGNIPADLKLAILILVSGLYNTKENYGTVECKIGQENFKFRDSTESEDFQRILKVWKKKFIFVM